MAVRATHRHVSFLVCSNWNNSPVSQCHLAFCTVGLHNVTERHKKCIIWSSSPPSCPSYPSSTSVPLGEWDRLPREGPHQFVGFHPPTTLTWGSSLLRAFEQYLTVTEARICAATRAHWKQETGSNLSAAIVRLLSNSTDDKKPTWNLSMRLKPMKRSPL